MRIREVLIMSWLLVINFWYSECNICGTYNIRVCVNVRQNWKPFCAAWRYITLVIVRITLNVIVRQMFLNVRLSNDVSNIQKRVVKLSNTSTTFSQQVEITLYKCLGVRFPRMANCTRYNFMWYCLSVFQWLVKNR